MKTVFVGGGAGCRDVLEMVVEDRLATLSLEILGVMDLDPDAPGMQFAREHGWRTFTDLEEALSVPGLDMVIELTGHDHVRDEIYRVGPPQVRVMDHHMARVFWDLDAIAQHLRDDLETKTRVEAVVRVERARLQELLDSLPDLVMVVDDDGTIRKVNRVFEELTGLSTRAALGRRCFDPSGNSPDATGCERAFCPRLAVLESGEPVTVVQQGTCLPWGAVQDEAFYEVTATPTYNSRGGVSVVMTAREVTDRVRLERQTEEAARRFAQIMEAVHGVITIKDLWGRYQMLNPAATQFYGLSEEAVMGRTARQLFTPEVAEVIEQNDAELLERGAHTSHKEEFCLEGEERTLITERIPLTDYRNRPIGICSVSRDITRQLNMQREMVVFEKHAAIGKLAAGVAHEINNPLTGILTFSEELLEDTPEDDPAHSDLEVIYGETLRCRQIVRDLLDFSRQEKPNRTETNLEPIIQRSLSLVRNQASFHDISFALDLAEQQQKVLADPNQLQQVMLDLVINARDAMDGKGEVAFRSYDQPDQNRVVVEVIDRGRGIPEHDLPLIFEPFFSTKGDQGNGLGLAAVRSIIDQHQGDIEVESTVGRGTVVRISLPAAKSPAAPAAGGQKP